MQKMKTALRLAIFLAITLAACTPGATVGPAGSTEVPATLPPTMPPVDVPTLPVPTVVPFEATSVPVQQPQLTFIQMLTEQEGWGLTQSGVLRTNDGGKSWHDVTPPGNPFLGYGAALSALDAGRASLVAPDRADSIGSGTLYQTTDGGATWSSNTTPFGTCLLRFLDMDKGWAMVSLGAGAGSMAIAIFRTIDGGANWQQVFTDDPNVEGSSDQIPLGGLKGIFVPLNMQTAWVGGVIYSDQTFYLYRTDDGGHTWSQVQLPPPPGSGQSQFTQFSMDDIQFITATDGFLFLEVTGDIPQLALYVTHDGGDTWTVTPTLIPYGRATDFVSLNDGFVFDVQGFQVTHDAGQTWTPVKPDVVFSDSFMSMDFVDATTGWVTASDPTTFKITIYKTADGGATWMPQ